MLGKKLGDEDLAQLRIVNHLARRYQNAISGNARLQPDVAAKLGIKSAGPRPHKLPDFAIAISARSGFNIGTKLSDRFAPQCNKWLRPPLARRDQPMTYQRLSAAKNDRFCS
jgi:hypothetical protein